MRKLIHRLVAGARQWACVLRDFFFHLIHPSPPSTPSSKTAQPGATPGQKPPAGKPKGRPTPEPAPAQAPEPTSKPVATLNGPAPAPSAQAPRSGLPDEVRDFINNMKMTNLIILPGEHGQEYAPLKILPTLLNVSMPPDWLEDPDFQLMPFVTAGTATPGRHIGVLGRMTRANEKLAVCYDRPFAHAYFGPPGFGKTYGDGCHIENVMIRTRYLNILKNRYCVISLSYEHGDSHPPELLASRFPNRNVEEVESLLWNYGSETKGIKDGLCFTLEDKVRRHRKDYPHWQTHALKFRPCILGILGLKHLMGLSEEVETFYASQFEEMIRTLPPGFTIADIERGLATHPFQNKGVRKMLVQRFAMAKDYLDDNYPPLRSYIKAGRLILLDIRDGWISPQHAMRLFAAFNYVMFMSGSREELPCPLLLLVDETHKFTDHPVVANQIEYFVRERRHLNLSLILSSQDPMSLPRSVIGQLDVVGVYRVDTQRWLDYLGQEIAAFRGVSVTEFVNLKPGQLWLWARHWHEESGLEEMSGNTLVCITVRPRMSQHGGPGQPVAEPGRQPDEPRPQFTGPEQPFARSSNSEDRATPR